MYIGICTKDKWRQQVTSNANECQSITCKVTAYVRYINILTWLRGFRVKILIFCFEIAKTDLDTKKTPPNKDVCPESLGGMLEY